MTYARQRLWLGISGVGTTVLLCLAAVTFDLPHRLLANTADQPIRQTLVSVALVWMAHALLLAPLDLVGGTIVVRSRVATVRWLLAWLRGVLVQWGWFALAAALLLRAGQQFGFTAAMLVFLLLQLVLLTRQASLAQLVGGLHVTRASPALQAAAAHVGIATARVREVVTDEPSFVGGWTGLDAGTLLVPQRWVTKLSAPQLGVALARRAGVRALGLRRRGVLVALAWNTAGFALASHAPRAEWQTAAGFVTMMAWFTLWSFVGVLVLPTVSRAAVFAADRWARSIAERDVIADTITTLDQWQDDEAERAAGVEAIFHPVPARGARLRALRAHDAPPDPVHVPAGAWHATRMMLFLSWAGLGGLSRAVHCNIGRPAVWVLLPGD